MVSPIPNVLFVDDENSILRLINIQTKGVVNFYQAGSYDEAMRILETGEIHIIVTDQNLANGEKGTDILSEVYVKYPDVRRIVLTSDRSLNTALVSINETSVHKYLIKPWKKKELIDVINSQYILYLEEHRTRKEFEELIKITQFLRQKVYSNSREMVSTLLSGDIGNKDPSQITAKVNEVIISLIEIAKRYIQSFSSNYNCELLFDARSTLSDIEMFASQYSIENLKIYTKLLIAYTNILAGDYAVLKRVIMEIQRAVYIRNRGTLPKSLRYEFMKLLEIMNDLKDGEDEDIEQKTIMYVNDLLELDLTEVIKFSPVVFDLVREEVASVSHLAIVKNGTTIFSVINDEVNPIMGTQIGNFVIALQDFFEVVLETSGRIETINHEKGTVLIWREDNISYVIISNQRSIYNRLSFQRFVEETYEMIKHLAEGTTPNLHQERILIEKMNQSFNCKIEIAEF